MSIRANNPINIAVVGCGYWGPNLIRNFTGLSGCAVTTVCEVNQHRAKHMKTLYPGIEVTGDFQRVIENEAVDAVAVATPVRLHYELARKSLLAGKHTLIEKPMASSVKECEELMAIAEEQGVTLMPGHTFIYSAPVRRIKEIIEWGDLGEIQYISSRRLNLGLFQQDINVAWDLAPHDISIILHVLKDLPVSVNCQGKAHYNKEIEDVTNMTVNYANGGFAIIQSSWLDPTKVREMTFVGTRRMLVYNDIEPMEKIKIYDKRVDTPPHYDTFAEFHYSYHHGDMYSPHIQMTEPLRTECQHFLDCIQTGTKLESGGIEGLRVVQILEAASESLKKGGAKVELQYATAARLPGMAYVVHSYDRRNIKLSSRPGILKDMTAQEAL